MNTKKNRVTLFTVAIVSVLLLIGVTGAQAASSMMNWTQTNYDAASGDLVFDFDPNSTYDLSDFEASVQADQLYIPQDNLVGTLYEFVIPNFYDPLPKKTVAITIKGANGGAAGAELAMVLDVFGADSEYGVPSPAVWVEGNLVDGTKEPTEVNELWEMFPNPDLDYVKIWAPIQFELESIQIVTQSVPLPPAALLLGSALFGLVFLRRKVS